MVVNELNILSFFHIYNEKYFNGVLPIPTLRIMHSYRTLGYFHCEIDNDGYILNPTIYISDNYEYTESQLKNIIVHEMIHYFLAYCGKDMKCHHGKEFRKMSQKLNSKYGLNITSTIDLTPFSIRNGKSNFMFKLCTLF